MHVDPVTTEVLRGPLVPVYVWEAPVRLAHWLFAITIPVLAITGFLIGDPIAIHGGDATFIFFFGWVRTVHFVCAYVLTITLAFRLYWAFVGNSSSRALFYAPVWKLKWWKGLFAQVRYYLFIEHERRWVGHNPLAQAAMFFNFTLGVLFMVLTGFALYAQQWGWGLTPMNLFGWQFKLFSDPQTVRTLHHLGMWYVLLFVMLHLYMVFREDIMSRQAIIGTMGSGIRSWKEPVRTE